MLLIELLLGHDSRTCAHGRTARGIGCELENRARKRTRILCDNVYAKALSSNLVAHFATRAGINHRNTRRTIVPDFRDNALRCIDNKRVYRHVRSA